jgi:hypothetical protein
MRNLIKNYRILLIYCQDFFKPCRCMLNEKFSRFHVSKTKLVSGFFASSIPSKTHYLIKIVMLICVEILLLIFYISHSSYDRVLGRNWSVGFCWIFWILLGNLSSQFESQSLNQEILPINPPIHNSRTNPANSLK